MSEFVPGTHVVVCNAIGPLSGKRGVVVDQSPEGVRGYDVVVLLDEDRGRDYCELGFYVHELAVVK